MLALHKGGGIHERDEPKLKNTSYIAHTKANLNRVVKGPIPYPAPGKSSQIFSLKRHKPLVKLNLAPRSIMRASCRTIRTYFHSRASMGTIRGGSIMGWNVSGARQVNPGKAKERVNWGLNNIGKSEILAAPDGPKPGITSPPVD